MVAGFDNVVLPRLITRVYSQKEKWTTRNHVKRQESRVVGTRKVVPEVRAEDGMPGKAGHSAHRLPRLPSGTLR